MAAKTRDRVVSVPPLILEFCFVSIDGASLDVGSATIAEAEARSVQTGIEDGTACVARLCASVKRKRAVRPSLRTPFSSNASSIVCLVRMIDSFQHGRTRGDAVTGQRHGQCRP
jgi:hypothetical protein